MLAMAAELDEYRAWLTHAYASATFTPFAARTQQYVKEQLGQADEKVGSREPLQPCAPAYIADRLSSLRTMLSLRRGWML